MNKAKQLLSDRFEFNLKLIQIKCVHRNGKYEQFKKPQTVAMELARFNDKDKIFKRVKNLRALIRSMLMRTSLNVRQKQSVLWLKRNVTMNCSIFYDM